MLHSKNRITSSFPFSLSHTRNNFLSPPNFFSPSTLSLSPLSLQTHHYIYSVSVNPLTRTEPWVAQVAESTDPTTSFSMDSEGPIEIQPSSSSIFATSDDPSPIQVATGVLLTGAISIFPFRSVRRRAKRAKEMKFRSSSAKKSIKEEALDNLKVMSTGSIEAKSPPSTVQAFLGAISADVIALILYKFTTTVEAALNRQTVSDSFSVRQLTVSIRTIINGLCYLVTFVFGINSMGLFLYSGQVAINSLMDG